MIYRADFNSIGVEGRGVVDALSFTIGSIQYDIRPMTRSLKGQLAQAFARDYPQLPLIEWEQGNIESLRLCFQGCYGVFLNLGAWTPGKDLKQWTRDQIEQGNRCIDAAKVRHLSGCVSFGFLATESFPGEWNFSRHLSYSSFGVQCHRWLGQYTAL